MAFFYGLENGSTPSLGLAFPDYSAENEAFHYVCGPSGVSQTLALMDAPTEAQGQLSFYWASAQDLLGIYRLGYKRPTTSGSGESKKI